MGFRGSIQIQHGSSSDCPIMWTLKSQQTPWEDQYLICLRVFDNMVDQGHNRWAFSRSMLIVCTTRPILSNDELQDITNTCITSCLKNLLASKVPITCEEVLITCSVLSNQRFPLLSWGPPPCNIWTAAQVRYDSSETPDLAPSKHNVKMLLWMVDTDSLLVLSEQVHTNTQKHLYGVNGLKLQP